MKTLKMMQLEKEIEDLNECLSYCSDTKDGQKTKQSIEGAIHQKERELQTREIMVANYCFDCM